MNLRWDFPVDSLHGTASLCWRGSWRESLQGRCQGGETTFAYVFDGYRQLVKEKKNNPEAQRRYHVCLKNV